MFDPHPPKNTKTTLVLLKILWFFGRFSGRLVGKIDLFEARGAVGG